jgi:hypothetical protein
MIEQIGSGRSGISSFGGDCVPDARRADLAMFRDMAMA